MELQGRSAIVTGGAGGLGSATVKHLVGWACVVVFDRDGGRAGGSRTVGREGTPHDKDTFVKTMEMNAVGTFNMTRLVAAVMAANEPDDHGQRGVVVNTASVAGIEGQAGQLAYAPHRQRLGLYCHFHLDNITHLEVACFLRLLLRHLRGPIVLLWDGGSIQRGPAVRDLLARHPRRHVDRFPTYAPERNPDEQVWSHFKAGWPTAALSSAR